MHKVVIDWCDACIQGKSMKSNRPLNHGLLEPIVSIRPFELVNIDIQGPYNVLHRQCYKMIKSE